MAYAPQQSGIGCVATLGSITLGKVLSFKGLGFEVSIEDVTSFSSEGWKEIAPILKSCPDITIETLATPEAQTALDTLMLGTSTDDEDFGQTLTFAFSDSASNRLAGYSWNGVVSKYDFGDVTPAGLIKTTLTYAISGKPTAVPVTTPTPQSGE